MAVANVSQHAAEALIRDSGLLGLEVAAVNSPGSVTISGPADSIQFGFNTVPNYPYIVQYEDSPVAGAWTTLTNFTGTGEYWQSPLLPVVPQRFYWVNNR